MKNILYIVFGEGKMYFWYIGRLIKGGKNIVIFEIVLFICVIFFRVLFCFYGVKELGRVKYMCLFFIRSLVMYVILINIWVFGGRFFIFIVNIFC